MGVLKNICVLLLPLILYGGYKFLKTYFLIVLILAHRYIPRLPFERFNELNPDVKDFVTPDDDIRSEYDFIIVGAGSAGSVLAKRLSENPEWNILLLEAGGGETLLTEIPITFFHNIPTEENWKYKTEPNADKHTSTMTKGADTR